MASSALAPTGVGPHLRRCAAGARFVIGEIVLASSAGTAVALVPSSHCSRNDQRQGGGGSLDAAHRAVGLPGSSHAKAALASGHDVRVLGNRGVVQLVGCDDKIRRRRHEEGRLRDRRSRALHGHGRARRRHECRRARQHGDDENEDLLQHRGVRRRRSIGRTSSPKIVDETPYARRLSANIVSSRKDHYLAFV